MMFQVASQKTVRKSKITKYEEGVEADDDFIQVKAEELEKWLIMLTILMWCASDVDVM